MDELIAVLRAMYAQQEETDSEGGREIAAYYYQESIEDALAVVVGRPVSLDPGGEEK